MIRVAIIGGSKEAVELARHFEGQIDYCLFENSYYGTPDGMAAQPYDKNTNWAGTLEGFSHIVLSPHPFAFRRLLDILPLDIPQIALRRAGWALEPNWHMAAGEDEAAQILTMINVKKPLLAVGRTRLKPFLTLTLDLQIRCRAEPLPDFGDAGTAILARGPFTVQQEMDYIVSENIDCIVAHNAGGQGGWPKLAAAKETGIPVILIDRPDIDWKSVTTNDEVIAWLGLDVPTNNP